MSKSHALLRAARWLHLYFGVFITPALLFFAFTGALQTFSLHEAGHEPSRSNYKPPAWLASLAQLHKKETLEVPARRPRPDFAQPAERQDRAGQERSGQDRSGQDRGVPRGERGDHQGAGAPTHGNPASAAAPSQAPSQAPSPTPTPAPKPKSHLPMKIFFLLVSIGLFLSTITGIYMSYRYTRNKLVITALLLAGIVIPLLLLPF